MWNTINYFTSSSEIYPLTPPVVIGRAGGMGGVIVYCLISCLCWLVCYHGCVHVVCHLSLVVVVLV